MVAVDALKEVAKSLRNLPVVDVRLPTVALVGAPNVGKSSLVQVGLCIGFVYRVGEWCGGVCGGFVGVWGCGVCVVCVD